MKRCQFCGRGDIWVEDGKESPGLLRYALRMPSLTWWRRLLGLADRAWYCGSRQESAECAACGHTHSYAPGHLSGASA